MLSQKRAREMMLMALAMGTYAHAAPSLDDIRTQLVPVTTRIWFGELQAVWVDLLIATVTAIEVLLTMSAGYSCSARANLSIFS